MECDTEAQHSRGVSYRFVAFTYPPATLSDTARYRQGCPSYDTKNGTNLRLLARPGAGDGKGAGVLWTSPGAEIVTLHGDFLLIFAF